MISRISIFLSMLKKNSLSSPVKIVPSQGKSHFVFLKSLTPFILEEPPSPKISTQQNRLKSKEKERMKN
jgi:hypothetical protein